MNFKVVIPARYGSTRLPGKPLLDIHGKPMIQWVVEAAARSGAQQVIVATDDERIAAAVRDPSEAGRVLVEMTHSGHHSATDRLAEVARRLQWPAGTIVVNVQGDEPQLPSILVDQVARLLAEHPAAHLATLCTPIRRLDEFLDPNVVKVARDDEGLALYFSRAPIPWHRSGAAHGFASQSLYAGAYRHIGIYAYRCEVLLRMAAMPPGGLELIESLEQLRAMQAGMRIAVAEAAVIPGAGVDTPEDIERLRSSEHFKK